VFDVTICRCSIWCSSKGPLLGDSRQFLSLFAGCVLDGWFIDRVLISGPRDRPCNQRPLSLAMYRKTHLMSLYLGAVL